jgi:hypothetical protein
MLEQKAGGRARSEATGEGSTVAKRVGARGRLFGGGGSKFLLRLVGGRRQLGNFDRRRRAGVNFVKLFRSKFPDSNFGQI